MKEPGKGRIKTGEDCGNVVLAIERRMGNDKLLTIVRVNCYGSLVNVLDQVSAGDYVIVDGELMNRRLKETNKNITEIRAFDIKIVKRREDNKNEPAEQVD